jgi:hypothetical protein
LLRRLEMRSATVLVVLLLARPTLADPIIATKGEVIVLEGLAPPPPVAPRPKDFSIRKAPPYSERAVLGDAWTRAWLLLDITADGRVARFKFLKRPGYDLEEIAAGEAFKLTFQPARDDAGKPVRGWMLWGIEWPANSYLISGFGVATRLPDPVRVARTIPCYGSGPWSPDAYYRDCSEPDWKRAGIEPWIVHDPARPAPKTAWD